ncbi:F-box domain cyclin [Fusarium albosuccineum]|uniref:F-box domain cyclin n=1 Tax=Fusarium albosuccineum TaxID=1237068 RepID=A0A8H4L2H2_9HYPO|nr:F-box domain cyclin [Fusarium albosuccineum]
MASLSDCPNEIQLHILRDLVPTTWNNIPASLHSICHVSKRFYSLAQPLLYSDVHLTWEGEDAEDPRIPLLLRTLLERPSLGNYVEHLSLEGDDALALFAPDDWVPCIDMAAVDMNKVLKFIKSTRISSKDANMWRTAVTEPFLDGAVATLLALLPDLKTLFMGPSFAAQMGVTNWMFHSALSPERALNPNQLPTFGQLRSVTVQNETYEMCEHAYWGCRSLPFFYLPEIERLSLAIHIGCYWSPSPPSPSKLTSLELHRLCPPELVKLLSITTGLKKLSWTCCCYPTDDPVMDDSFDFIDLDNVSEALSKVSGTLEELVFKIDYGTHESSAFEMDADNIDITGSLRGLLTLVHLKKLQVPWVWLMDWSSTSERLSDNFVPESVETLIITLDITAQTVWLSDELLIFEWMAGFLEGQQGFANLHIVILESNGILDNAWGTGEEMDLGLIADEAGIIFLMDPDASEIELAEAELAEAARACS